MAELTLGAIISKIAEGLPVAVGLFLLLAAGYKGVWCWKRELDMCHLTWQKRFDEAGASAAARLVDSKTECAEWKDIARRTIGAAEKIVPAVVQAKRAE